MKFAWERLHADCPVVGAGLGRCADGFGDLSSEQARRSLPHQKTEDREALLMGERGVPTSVRPNTPFQRSDDALCGLISSSVRIEEVWLGKSVLSERV